MSQPPLNVLAVVGSLHRDSVTRCVVHLAAERLRAEGVPARPANKEVAKAVVRE